MPFPCGFNNILQLNDLSFPSECFVGFARVGNQFGWIAFSSGFFHAGDGFASDFFAGLNDFPNRMTTAYSQVVATGCLGFDGFDMSAGQVDDVDVVANAGSVRSGVIGAKDVTALLLSEGDLEHIRDDVTHFTLALAPVFGGPGGVEISECDIL